MMIDSPDPERYAGRLAPLGAILFVLGIALGEWYGGLLALLGTIALIFACRSRDGFLLLGPFVRSELIRAARTRRLALWRFVYAAAAALMLLVCFSDATFGPGSTTAGRGFDRYTLNFFITFSVVQFCYLTYLTISLIAPIVAEEREAKRWDFLLATDLRAREILIGKAVGRLPLILDPILAALPVLVLSTLFGGVSPRLVIAVSLATLAMLFGTAGIAFFFSVFAPTAKIANERTSGIIFAYVTLTGSFLFFVTHPIVWNFPTSSGIAFPVDVGDAVELVGTGNPITVVVMAQQGQKTGVQTFEPLFETGVRKFVAFQIGTFFLFGLRAMQRLRSAIPWKVAEKTKRVAAKVDDPDRPAKPRRNFRPPIGEWPVYWLERYGQLSAGQMKSTAWFTPKKYAAFGLFAAVVLIGVRVVAPYLPGDEPVEIVQKILRLMVCVLTLMPVLPAVVRGARCVARERAADTLDSLLLTGLTPRDILFQKWLGVATADLPLVGVGLTLAVAGALTGFLHPLVPVVVAMTVAVYTAVAAAVGMYYSVRATTPARAVRNTILIGIGLLYLFGSIIGAVPGNYGYVVAFPPAAAIGIISVPSWDRPDEDISTARYFAVAACVAVGLGFYSGIGWLAWRFAVKRFERERHN